VGGRTGYYVFELTGSEDLIISEDLWGRYEMGGCIGIQRGFSGITKRNLCREVLL